MATFLSFNRHEGLQQWRVIHNGSPLTSDYDTAHKAVDAVMAVFSNLHIESRWWNGELGYFTDEYNVIED